MAEAFSPNKLIRKNFGKIERIIDISNLIEMQKESYERFLQKDSPPEQRGDFGLQGVFKSVFPIQDFSGTAFLEFVNYSFAPPKYDEEECLQRGMTFEAPMKLKVRLGVYDIDPDTKTQSIRDIKEQEIYFGTLPLMTDNGTFIINGTERVIVSQLHRSPGLFIDHDRGKTHSSGKLLYSARLIPMRGSWIDLEFDPKDILYARIDRRRKFPVTLLLKALGYTTEELLNFFYKTEKIYLDGESVSRKFIPEFLVHRKATSDIIHPVTGDILVKKMKKITPVSIRKMQEAGIDRLLTVSNEFLGRVVAHDILDPATGEVLLACNEELTEDQLTLLRSKGVTDLDLLYIDGINVSPCLRNTLAVDKTVDHQEAIKEIYRKLRPGNPPTLEVAANFFENLFFRSEYYDLSPVGRLKLNLKLDQDLPITQTTLTREDILYAVRELINQKEQEGSVDDIDHLGNRRVRAVGELLENQYRIGLVRMERAIKERMSLQEIDTLMPHDLINAKPVTAVVKEFFGTSQLSQFMDQTNPLSEVTHKRRLSALGPGGLTRERAGFEVRDVHPTHYGRICPIETPEGPNIGLIVSLSTYARVNDFGFIETPYRKVEKQQEDGKWDVCVSREIHFLSALQEGDHVIAQANIPLDRENRFLVEMISARKGGEFVMVRPEEVDYMDVSPSQLVSVAASLIPFLENDDANRALMGSNMQRQAVPLLTCTPPIIGTGMEGVVARDSGVTIVARRPGEVVDVDGTRIVVRADDPGSNGGSFVDIYKLTKFQRTNQNTCFNQRPIVRRGDRVDKGQIIADGPSTFAGELALGKNVMVAFMPWGGYNFEDSILVSERIVKEDVFTSIHIEEFEVMARDTKLGKEEITRDIPNVGEEALGNLDECGIIRVGAEIRPGDILVGKVTPKGETQLSPEEKLLRAIFGEKAGDVRDTSLRVPPGIDGIVIDARVFSRKGVEKDERTRAIEDEAIAKLQKDQGDELDILAQSVTQNLANLLVGRKIEFSADLEADLGGIALEPGGQVTLEQVQRLPLEQWRHISFQNPDLEAQIDQLLDNYQAQVLQINQLFEDKINRLRKVDELPPGVIKMVKVFVAMKRKLSVGDKMAGRHGNKGVVSRIMPEEDMPYFPDGTPVDIVLNPLGVPSRMNVGQVLETHLGWACRALGQQIGQMINEFYQPEAIKERIRAAFKDPELDAWLATATYDDLHKFWQKYGHEGIYIASPVFDGATEAEIRNFLNQAGLAQIGKAVLYDGRSGDRFDREVTVGAMYMMKLHHLVDDKIHARSIGPYSLVTQQPLGGKAQFGGQRLGEMEVWAMEAYGAAYSLQEFLTVKSDDVAGRTRMYEKIVKGQFDLEAGLPESFNVLVRELQSLALNVELLEDNAQEVSDNHG